MSLDNLCFHANQFATIKELINKFLLKHSQFNDCSEAVGGSNAVSRAAINCSPNDGSNGRLVFLIDPNSKFSMNIQDKPNYLGSVKDVTAFEGITCWKDSNTATPICKGIGSIASYSLKWEPSLIWKLYGKGDPVICTESTATESSSSLGPCENGLSLFSEILQNSPQTQSGPQTQPAPENPPTPSPSFTGAKIKISVGIAAAIFFGYKTVQEVRKYYSEKNRKIEESSREESQTKSLAEKNPSQRSLTNNKPSNQRTIAYAAATTVALLFSAHTYFSEIA